MKRRLAKHCHATMDSGVCRSLMCEEAAVDNETEIDQRIMEVVSHLPQCEMDEVALHCEDLTWNQVFFAVDRLTRRGELHLRVKRPGVYTLCPLEHVGTGFVTSGLDGR